MPLEVIGSFCSPLSFTISLYYKKTAVPFTSPIIWGDGLHRRSIVFATHGRGRQSGWRSACTGEFGWTSAWRFPRRLFQKQAFSLSPSPPQDAYHFHYTLSPFYRTYYKATIKAPPSVWRGYCKAYRTRLSDNCVTVIQIVIKLATFMSPTYNDHFRQATKMATKNHLGDSLLAWWPGGCLEPRWLVVNYLGRTKLSTSLLYHKKDHHSRILGLAVLVV